MRLRTKGIIIILVVLAGVVMVFIPFIPGPDARCADGLLCIPNQTQSVARYFLGFGGESSYGRRFYYFCTGAGCSNSWFG